jgi:hypothetical protein
MGGPQSWSGQRGEEKILDPTRTRTPTPQLSSPIASRYTDYAIPAPRGEASNDIIVKKKSICIFVAVPAEIIW